MNCTNGFCNLRQYLRSNSSSNLAVAINSTDVPESIKTSLNSATFQPSKQNDGRYLGPPDELQSKCYLNSSQLIHSTIYCTRLTSGTWIAWQWYRFVDQPELNQVFASLPENERQPAKCYMQARIERLHQSQQSVSINESRWFAPPQGDNEMPADLVSVDPALLLTPPSGLEIGYVPIPITQLLRTRPSNCQVALGVQTESNPLPNDYYQNPWAASI